MQTAHVLVVAVAAVTWASFTAAMRYYFKHARKTTAAKSWLTVCAGLCTLAQMAALIVFSPPTPVHAGVGVAGFLLAALLYGGSVAAHGRTRPAFAFVPVAPAAFTQRGPYRLIRHPIYSAYLLTWLAAPVAAGQYWLLLPALVMAGFYYRAARQEEVGFAASPFGAQYQEYQRRTGMFLPRLLPF